jgi:hypothetical protein
MRDWDLNRPRSVCEHPATALRHARNLVREAGVRGVPVELAGDGPCAGPPSFSEGGAVVRFESYSRVEAADRFEVRIGDTLLPLAETGGCEDPQRAAARARRLLADAGLGHLIVRVDEPSAPCFDPGGTTVTPAAVTLSTDRG